MLWIKDRFGGFLWYNTRNSISETVFTHSRVKQRLFRSSASCCVYVAQALRTFTCPALLPVSILADTDPLVVSIGTHPEASLGLQAAWTHYEVLCCCQGHTSVYWVSVALRILSQLPGHTFLIFCSRKCTHFTEKSFSREQRMRKSHVCAEWMWECVWA